MMDTYLIEIKKLLEELQKKIDNFEYRLQKLEHDKPCVITWRDVP